MNLKIVIPTKDFAFEAIIKNWFEMYEFSALEQYSGDRIDVIMEKGLPPSGYDVRQKYTEELQNSKDETFEKILLESMIKNEEKDILLQNERMIISEIEWKRFQKLKCLLE